MRDVGDVGDVVVVVRDGREEGLLTRVFRSRARTQNRGTLVANSPVS